MSDANDYYLRRALALAQVNRGFCAPNPCVGAVLVKNNQIIAEGYHLGSGLPHAEATVLTPLTLQQTENATLYVTLQPCCHTKKKTPPCTDLIIAKKLTKIVYGYQDPNPAVGSTSDTLLQQAGVSCIQRPLPEIDAFYAHYTFWWKTKRPWVTAKIALSLDGKITAIKGQRTQLTGPNAAQFTHQQRQQADALLTTAKTILVDNPQLNVRLGKHIYSKPVYILDRQLTIPLSAQIFSTAKQVTLFHQEGLSSAQKMPYLQAGVRLFSIPHEKEGLNLLSVLEQIGREGHHDLWVESGGHCFEQFAQNKLLQRAFVYIAPICLGSAPPPAFTHSPFNEAQQIRPPQILGQDVCFTFDWPPEYK